MRGSRRSGKGGGGKYGVWNRGAGSGPVNPIRVRTKRLDEIDHEKIALAYWLLAKEIAKHGRQPRLFVEVNTGAEPQKAGVLPEHTDAFLTRCRQEYGLRIEGLMCIPPFDDPPAPHFALLAKIAKRNGLPFLSMGMSADFPRAIEFGATHVRVGTAIFGERKTNQ